MTTADGQCMLEEQDAIPPSLKYVAILLVAILVFKVGIHLARSKDHHPTIFQTPFVPFVVLQDSVPTVGNHQKSHHDLLRSIAEGYQREGSQALHGLSSMLDEALVSEQKFRIHNISNTKKKNKQWLSAKIEQRIQMTAECLEHDEQVLARLLGNFSYVLALPDKEMLPTDVDCHPKNDSTNFRIPSSTAMSGNASDTHSYDSATQIWAHLVRDWTAQGKTIRHTLYGWCCQKIRQRINQNSNILVPGSGMGRLAYDLSRLGYRVEANELSPSMAAAARAVLSGRVHGSFHPYLLDGMANEVHSKRRFAEVKFPDVKLEATPLSYTVGDFVGTDYYRQQRKGHFDAIVTCFFLDTATNIYEYLEVIENLLHPKGVWVNVGPVQWHHNALLRPSVDELKELLEACGWTIKLWSIDTKPITYRDQNADELLPPMTSYDGYRPLRFVAIRKP